MLETKGQFYSISPDISLRAIKDSDQYWAFNLVNGDHYELNKTAYWLLSSLKEKHTIDDVIRLFSNNFDVKDTDYKKDIIKIVSEFIQQALIIKERCNNEKD